jgi:hypothetical protein
MLVVPDSVSRCKMLMTCAHVPRNVSIAARTQPGQHLCGLDCGGRPAVTSYQPQQGVSVTFGAEDDIARVKSAEDRIDDLRSRRDRGGLWFTTVHCAVCAVLTGCCALTLTGQRVDPGMMQERVLKRAKDIVTDFHCKVTPLCCCHH